MRYTLLLITQDTINLYHNVSTVLKLLKGKLIKASKMGLVKA